MIKKNIEKTEIGEKMEGKLREKCLNLKMRY